MIKTKQRKPAFKKGILFFILLLSFLVAETGLPGYNAFTSSSQLGLGGAGYLFANPISSKMNPSVSDTGRYFVASIIRYPADIICQSVGLSLPVKQGFASGSLRHINYGTFDGYDDELNSTGTYQSSDTWISGTYSFRSKTMPLQFGVGGDYFNSSLDQEKIQAISLSFGGEYYLHRIQTSLGLSYHHFGKAIENGAMGQLATKTVLSLTKRLVHLPLTFFFDTIWSEESNASEIFLGGQFKLNNGVRILWGTSTRKQDHNLEQDFFRTVLGATGVGFGVESNNVLIQYSTFMFGTGTTIHGVEIGVQF